MGNDSIGLQLMHMLETTNGSVVIPHMMPKFLKVKNSGLLKPAHQLLKDAVNDDDELNYRNLSLKLYENKYTSEAPPLFWYEKLPKFNYICTSKIFYLF